MALGRGGNQKVSELLRGNRERERERERERDSVYMCFDKIKEQVVSLRERESEWKERELSVRTEIEVQNVIEWFRGKENLKRVQV